MEQPMRKMVVWFTFSIQFLKYDFRLAMALLRNFDVTLDICQFLGSGDITALRLLNKTLNTSIESNRLPG